MRALRCFACAIILGGCYLSHERVERDGGPVPRSDAGPLRDGGRPRDAGRRIDVGIAFDAGPTDHFWTMEPARVAMSYQGCEARSGTTLFVTLQMELGACEQAGPVEVTPPGEDMFEWHVQAWKWVEHGVICAGPAKSEPRTVAIGPGGSVGGSFLDVREDTFGSTLRIRLDPPAPTSCLGSGGEGDMCAGDCDCGDGMRCAAVRGDAWCGEICTHPCDLDLDCPLGRACSDTTTATPGCRDRDGPECDGDEADCGAGRECALGTDGSGFCTWRPILSGSTRHLCRVDEDCEAPLHCVQTPEGVRTCQLPCFTREMACPSMHACMLLEGRIGWPWICEWLGE